MFGAIIEAIIDVLLRAAGSVAGVVRSVFAGHAADAGLAAAEDRASRPGRRRRGPKDKLNELAEPGDTEQLVRTYHQLARNDSDRDLRIEAITRLSEENSAVAEPILREIIQGPDDPWVVIYALDAARRHRMTGLLDVVTPACEDPRPAVAAAAGSAHKRLQKAMRRTQPQVG
jgi:hypothetical protein